MDHVRIDEGVKRGKRGRPPGNRNKPRNEQDPKTGKFLPVVPADQHFKIISTASARIEAGESLLMIAAEIGVTPQAIGQWLLDEQPQQYKLAQRRGLIKRIIDADNDLATASDPLSLARAREAARFARWDAERRLPSMFGPKQEVTHLGTPVLNITFASQPALLQSNDPAIDAVHERIEENKKK